MSPIRVLSRPTFSNRRVNPYNAVINAHLGQFGVRIEELRRLREAVLRPADVIHVHWPETLFNHGLRRAVVRTSALNVALWAARGRGRRILWTAHNVFAHERLYPDWEARFWRGFIPLVDGVITLNAAAERRALAAFPALADRPRWVLPHPHYRGAYPDVVSRADARAELGLPSGGRVVGFVGRILQYKQVPALIHAVRRVGEAHPDVCLVVAGRPRTRRLHAEVLTAAGGDPRVRLRLEHIAPERLQTVLRAVDLVALPYRDVLHSGSAMLALSFDRPVLLPRRPTSEALQAQVGRAWVHLYEALEDQPILAALDAARRLPDRTDGAHLRSFDPVTVARQTAEIYRALLLSGPRSC